MFVNSGMDKQIIVHPYNGIQLSHKKKQTIDVHNIDDSHIILSKKNQGNYDPLLHDSVYTKF